MYSIGSDNDPVELGNSPINIMFDGGAQTLAQPDPAPQQTGWACIGSSILPGWFITGIITRSDICNTATLGGVARKNVFALADSEGQSQMIVCDPTRHADRFNVL